MRREPIRVGMVTRDYPPAIGGIATHTYQLVGALQDLGAEVEVVEGKSDFGTLMVPVRRDLSGFDLVHVQSTPYGAFAKGHPLVITAHSPVIEERKYYTGINRLKAWFAYRLEKRALKKADHVISVSQLTRNQLLNEYGVKADKVTLISNGVDCKSFNPYLKATGKPPKILICSRFDPRKNIIEALEALAAMKDFPFELAVIGDGPERPRLEDAAKRLPHHVYFLGTVSQDEIFRNFSYCNIFLSASHSEGFGLSLLQAMASGCAVLVSDIPVHRELVTDGVDGLLFATHEELVAKLKELLTIPDLVGTLGRKAREKAMAYSWENVAKATMSVYSAVLQESKSSWERRTTPP